MSRYGDNIRRIAKTDELRDLVRQAEQRIKILEKDGIPGQRGIAYQNSTAVGTPGQTNPDNNGEQFRPGIFNNNPSKGGIDDTTTDGDALLTAGGIPDKGEDIGAIQLKDCDTGERIDVRFNTGGNTGESLFKHPTGFSNEGVAPAPSGFVEVNASKWVWAGGGVTFQSYDDAKDAAIDAEPLADAFVDWVTDDPREAATAAVVLGGDTTNTQPAVQFSVTRVGGGPDFNLSITGTNCNRALGVTGDTATTCALADPVATTWKQVVADTPHQLAFSAEKGGFVSSRFDADIPLNFKNPASQDTDLAIYETGKGLSKLQLCTPDGNPVVVETLKDGTFTYFEDDGFGDPDVASPILHFDKDGKYLNTLREDEYEYLTV